MGGGKGGGGGASNNMSMMMQQQAADEARQKEEQRAARLRQGEAAINAMFDPEPIMETRKVKGKVDPNKLPTGFAKKPVALSKEQEKPEDIVGYTQEEGGISRPVTRAQRDAGGAAAPAVGISNPLFGEGIFDAAGNMVTPGTEVEYEESFDTGRTRDKFGELKDRYRKSQTDYYMPELAEQFDKARNEATYGHARAGTLWGSSAGETGRELGKQNMLNTANIQSQIENSIGELTRQIASDKSALINQLYATENPEMAANEALARTKTISQQSPALSPIGDLFKVAAIGLGGALGQGGDAGYGNVRRKFDFSSGGSGRNVIS